MDFATIYRSYSATDANLICSRLQAAGFKAEVVHETAGLTTAGSITTGGLEIQVPTAEAVDARGLIDSLNE